MSGPILYPAERTRVWLHFGTAAMHRLCKSIATSVLHSMMCCSAVFLLCASAFQ